MSEFTEADLSIDNFICLSMVLALLAIIIDQEKNTPSVPHHAELNHQKQPNQNKKNAPSAPPLDLLVECQKDSEEWQSWCKKFAGPLKASWPLARDDSNESMLWDQINRDIYASLLFQGLAQSEPTAIAVISTYNKLLGFLLFELESALKSAGDFSSDWMKTSFHILIAKS